MKWLAFAYIIFLFGMVIICTLNGNWLVRITSVILVLVIAFYVGLAV